MNENYKAQALEKLNEKIDKLSSHGNAVKEHVLRVLRDFCEQNTEFAQAIAQSDKTVKDCIEYTVKGAGTNISDFAVYGGAAEFWFSGAAVKFEALWQNGELKYNKMILDLGDGGFSNESSGADKPKRLEMSLDDLF